MKHMKEKVYIIAFWAIFAVMLVGGLYYEFKIWNECRESNSLPYCMRMMQR